MQTPASTITQIGDLGGQKVQMGIDKNALAHIMSVLTDLYSDPQMAVIREYSTNALDAHIEAGNKAPIEVFTPSAYSSYFKVKDQGVGLSVDDIVNMYSQYGASSKRGTNDQVGMLGLGAKSALTLVPQFNLTSVKNGVKIFVSISRSSDGSGQMEIIDTVSTDEPNGVEISVPIPRDRPFAEKVQNFFRFWQPGTVLVDGKQPEHISGRKVGDNFIVNTTLDSDYVVMGNVAYPVKDSIYTGNHWGHLGVVAFVEIGDVNFTPSREALHYTPQTKATIGRLRQEFNSQLQASCDKDLATAPDHATAWANAAEWRRIFSRNMTLTYKGMPIPTQIATHSGKQWSLQSGGRYGRRGGTWVRGFGAEDYKGRIFVLNFAASLKMSPVQREKVAIYCAQNNISAQDVVVFDQPDMLQDVAHSAWMSNFKTVDWADIAKIKVARNVSTNRVLRTDPYDLYTAAGTKQVSTLDTSKEIIYFSSAELSYPSWMFEYWPDAQIVWLNKNRWDKFKRDWPTAKHYTDALKEYQNSLISKITDADKILWHHSNQHWYVKGLKAAALDDPALHQFVTVLNGDRQFSKDAAHLRMVMRKTGVTPDIEDLGNPLTNYPLAGNMSGVDTGHVTWYLNTYYNTNLKENN